MKKFYADIHSYVLVEADNPKEALGKIRDNIIKIIQPKTDDFTIRMPGLQDISIHEVYEKHPDEFCSECLGAEWSGHTGEICTRMIGDKVLEKTLM